MASYKESPNSSRRRSRNSPTKTSQTTAGPKVEHPDRDKRQHRTLIDVVDKHAAQFDLSNRNYPGHRNRESLSDDGFDFGMSVLRAIFTAIPLSILHLFLTYLIASVYSSSYKSHPPLWEVFLSLKSLFPQTALRTFPFLTFISVSLELLIASLPIPARGRLKSTGWFLVATTAGCWMVYVVEMRGYMAVMKYAPGAGTFWIWGNVEMGVGGCIISAVSVATWAVYMGSFS
jgi:hypothetical protein